MQVVLAGFNVDREVLKDNTKKEVITPETISAAYARISRSKKSVTALRQLALHQVEKARNSNSKIIFDMGHSSIAEHAVFNFDIIGVSRYLVEFIERTRLASFTEKSQRYVTLDGDFVIPNEIKNTSLEDDFVKLVEKQNETYNFLYSKSKKYLEKTSFKGSKRDLEGKAKEDARYVLCLATQTQLGMTINARSLERLLCRLDSLDLTEAAVLKAKIEKEIHGIAPSLIKYTNSNNFQKNYLQNVPIFEDNSHIPQIDLIDYDKNGEDKILAALLFQKNEGLFQNLLKKVKKLSPNEKEKIFSGVFADMRSYHSVPRCFELAYFTFQLSLSSSCFGQLKRHRMSTILKCNYNPKNGYVIPSLLLKIGAGETLKNLMNDVDVLFHKLEEYKAGLGAYILTNSHRVNVIFHANLRELYHFSRLRSDKHAQWEIREISLQIDVLVRNLYPFAAKYLMGKDSFEE
ncbi:MAG: FAD-dependent thymidylate synthase [Candidatus Cloacimonadota bacterium]|nr:FAD-dependent thymidylate synthase [Candidatus Cloacimonadota bacterium]